MKAINEKFQEGLDSIVNSPGWIKIYSDAPIGAKEALELKFYYFAMKNKGTPITIEKLLELCRNKKNMLKKADYEYLSMFAKDPREKAFYAKCIAEATE